MSQRATPEQKLEDCERRGALMVQMLSELKAEHHELAEAALAFENALTQSARQCLDDGGWDEFLKARRALVEKARAALVKLSDSPHTDSKASTEAQGEQER